MSVGIMIAYGLQFETVLHFCVHLRQIVILWIIQFYLVYFVKYLEAREIIFEFRDKVCP